MSSKSQSKDILSEETVSRSAKLAFGGATFSSGILSGIGLGGALTYFYNVIFLLDERWVSLAFAIFIGWNAVNDPLFGFLEDKTKTRWGRRVPYLRFGAPIYAILFILIWFPFFPPDSDVALFFNLLIILFVFDTIYTIIGLITYSLPAEMAISSRARSNLMVYGAISSSMAFLLTFILPDQLIVGEDSPPLPIFLITMIIMGIICGIILFASSYYIKEKKYTIMEESLTYKASLIETFKNKPFLIFEGSNFSWLIAQYILINGLFYYLDYVLDLSGLMSLIPLVIFFAMVFSFTIVYSKLLNKYPLKKVFIFILLLTGGAFILHFFIGWNFSTAIIGMVLLGIGFSGYWVTNQLVIAEAIDYDEVRTGKRRETSYSGVNALITKPAVSIGPMIFLSIISAFGFNNEVAQQTESAQFGIMLAFTIIPAIFILISAAIISFFPLTGPEWREKKAKLEEKHREKERNYLRMLKEKGKL
ncbi:MAG: putative symporter YjmB [Promethearchaeota archaeon]|nr:MAG: putative symporter YjmB [Candidatus Lokiarchaeota archaeon]